MQMGEKNRENSLSEIFNDYEKTPVPPKARQTWFEQGMVWLGSGFGLSGLATGGLLANGLSFKEMLLVSVLGSLIITLLGMLNAIVSTHLHLSTSCTARRPFGRQGAKIIGIILCFSNFGWYAFQADLFGNTVSSIIREVRGTAINPVIFTIIGGLAMSLTAIMGFKAIKKLSEIGLPLLFVLCIVAVWKTAGIIPMSSILEAGPVGEPMTIPMGISIVVGSFAVGIAMIGDFSRFSTTKKDCAIGVSIGHFWGYIPVLMCGAFFNYAFHNWNIVEIMIESLGLGFFGAVVLIIGQWTTNDNNLYTSVLGLMNTLDGVVKISRMKLTFIVGIISTMIAGLGVYKYFVNFLSLLGVFIAPITGILIADFYLCNRKSYDKEGDGGVEGCKYGALASWAIASFVGITMTAKPVGLGWFTSFGDIVPTPIVCIIVAVLCYCTAEKISVKQSVAAPEVSAAEE